MFAKKIRLRQLGFEEPPSQGELLKIVKELEPELPILEKKIKVQEKPLKKELKQQEKKQQIVEKQLNDRKPEIIPEPDLIITRESPDSN